MQQRAITQRIPLSSFVSSDNLHGQRQEDECVFLAASSRELGVRYTDACIGYLDDFVTDSPQEIEWQYIDSNGNVRGPYPTRSMRDWYRQGYLKSDLQVRCVGMNEFVRLETLGDRPFDAALVNVKVEKITSRSVRTTETMSTTFSSVRPTHLISSSRCIEHER